MLDVAFSANPGLLAVAYSDDKLIVHDVDSGGVVQEFELTATPQTILVSNTGDTYFVGTRTGELVILDAADGSFQTIDAHQGRINSIAIFPDGKRIVSAGRDQVINLWDAESRERVAMLRGHERQVFALAVSPDGTCIASAGLAGDLRLWRVN